MKLGYNGQKFKYCIESQGDMLYTPMVVSDCIPYFHRLIGDWTRELGSDHLEIGDVWDLSLVIL